MFEKVNLDEGQLVLGIYYATIPHEANNHSACTYQSPFVEPNISHMLTNGLDLSVRRRSTALGKLMAQSINRMRAPRTFRRTRVLPSHPNRPGLETGAGPTAIFGGR